MVTLVMMQIPMHAISHILAAAEDEGAGKIVIAVIAVIIWGISALAKQAGKSTAKQKERMRQVRESIERAHAQNQPVTLDPEIARRLPPPVIPQSQMRRPPAGGRPATNYDQMTARPRTTPPPMAGKRVLPPPVHAQRAQLPPQQIPGRAKAAKRAAARMASRPPVLAATASATLPAAILLPETPRAAAAPRPTARPPLTAVSVKRWATPATLRQQFILTEIFQPPLAMREEHLR